MYIIISRRKVKGMRDCDYIIPTETIPPKYGIEGTMRMIKQWNNGQHTHYTHIFTYIHIHLDWLIYTYIYT